MTDYNQCQERLITALTLKRAIKMLRMAENFVFVSNPSQTVPPPTKLSDPAVVFQVAFNKQADARIVARVRQKFAAKKRELEGGGSGAEQESRDAPGYIYCFHDIGDQPNVLKIGRTSRTPEERLAEWERELAPESGQSLIMLFAYHTDCNEFAEDIIHDLLSCRQIHNRINPNTGGELVEFFTIDNALALSIFIRETLRFINQFWRTTVGATAAPPRRR